MRESGSGLTVMMFLFISVGVLMSGLGVPLMLRRVRPNPSYGIRTPQTLSDERVWYDANQYCGRLIVGLGISLISVSILLRVVPRIGASVAGYSVICGVWATLGVMAVAVLSIRRADAL